MNLPVSAELLLVIATLVGIVSFSSIVAGWTMRRWPFVALIAFALAVAVFVYVHMSTPGGMKLTDVPNAFIAVAAQILN